MDETHDDLLVECPLNEGGRPIIRTQDDYLGLRLPSGGFKAGGLRAALSIVSAQRSDWSGTVGPERRVGLDLRGSAHDRAGT